MNTLKTILGITSLAIGSAQAVLVSYDITAAGDLGTDSTDTNLTATPLNKEFGAAGATSDGGWLLNGTNFDADGVNGGDNDAADADDRFFTFCITADAGYTLSVDSIDWTVGVRVANSPRNAFHYSLVYVSDTSDFSNILAESGTLGQDPATAPGGLSAPVGYHEESFSFTGLNLTGHSKLYFAVESSNVASHGREDPIFQAFSVDGSVVAVPEPSSTALLGLGGLALIARRRR